MTSSEWVFDDHPPPRPAPADTRPAPLRMVDSATGVPSDADLIAGSRADFGVLFDRHASRLYQYCARRVGVGMADDVVAEVFLIAYRTRRRYNRARLDATPWLYGIATNVIRRHRDVEARVHREAAAWIRADGAAIRDDFAERVAERADARAVVQALASTLARMSPRHRDVLFLFASGLDHDQVAAALGLPLGTVRSRLHRARAKIRQALSGSATLPGFPRNQGQ
jgi:RNA polymerase sigma factor (sigma-70 family)